MRPVDASVVKAQNTSESEKSLALVSASPQAQFIDDGNGSLTPPGDASPVGDV
jgi:hypothetical protein